MESKPVLVVMLTCDDETVSNAYEIFDKCKDSKAEYWGFKEKPLPLEEMKKLYAYMKSCGKKTVLEVVAYTEAECLEGAKMAIECPFVGELKERPTVMDGSVEKMIRDAKEYLAKGAYGIDLLGYRYTGNAYKLIDKFVASVDTPVCVAGSINSYDRLDEIKKIHPASFTIGSAFFNNCFGSDFSRQIDKVCEYMEQ